MTLPLPLYGVAPSVCGFASERPWQVIRVRSPDSVPSHHADAALVRSQDDADGALRCGFTRAIVISDEPDRLSIPPNANCDRVIMPAQYGYLADGDILGFQPASRRFRALYRRSSAHNSFLVTERCNHHCIMCSQPPRDIDDRWLLEEIRSALPLVDPHTKSFAFTGGEPLLQWRAFIEVLQDCRDALPNTAVHVLSNGRTFARSEVVSAWASVRHPGLSVGIPIYAAVDHVHDYVVQASGAFDETVLGVLKLKDKGQCVEIRIVLHAITAPRIIDTCCWLARNLPFVDHVALMGLEHTGFALANDKLLWIDPIDYQEDLATGVEILASAGVNVSVYNLPRCVLARSVWPYTVQSISDWKNGYVEECDQCVEKQRCSGFFTSGRPRQSRAIKPIQAEAKA